MKRRAIALSGLLLAAGLAAMPARADLIFAVNEGVTYRVPNEEIRARYAAMATDLSRMLQQPVQVEPVADYPSLRKGLADKTFDLAMVHPAHVSIEAIKKSGYRLLVITKGYENYSARFLLRADSPIKTLGELKGQRVGAPDEDSITSWMVRATLRDALGAPGNATLTYTRYQDAVPFFVENRLTLSGATAANGVVKAWQEKGGKVLAASKPVPIKHIIASPKLSAEQAERVREYLLALDTSDEGRKKLAATRYQGFMRYDDGAMMALGTWLGL